MAVLAAAVWIGCTQTSSKAEKRRVLVLGMDGIDWAILDRLMDEGRLPNFSRVVREGVSAPLISLEDFTSSPVIWTSILTGRLPEEHGVTGFTSKDPVTGQEGPVSAVDRKTPAVWNMFTQHHMNAVVLGQWATFPVEPVSGVLVSDRAAFLASKPETQWALTDENRVELTYPPMFFDKTVLPLLENGLTSVPEPVDRSLGKLMDLTIPDRVPGTLDFPDFHDDDVHFFKQSFREDLLKDILGMEILENVPPDLYINYFRGTDVSEHFFWRYWEPELFGEKPVKEGWFDDLIPSYYEYMDEILGRHLSLMSGNDSLLIVSDHGQIAQPMLQGQINWARRVDDEGWASRNRTFFSAMGFRWPAAGVREGLAGVSYASGWGKDSLTLRLDPQAAGMTLEALRDEVMRRVSTILLLPSNLPLFALDETPGEPEVLRFAAQHLPLAEFETRVKIRDAEYALSEVFRLRKRSGDHRREGVFLAMGADFKSGEAIDEVSVLDVAPLLLSLFNLPRGEQMTGRPPLEALRGRALDWAKNQQAEDYDQAWVRKTGAGMQDSEFLKQMEALGYL